MVASPIAWEAAQDALHAWVVGATEIPAARVLWVDQNVAQPSVYPFATLHVLSGPRSLGQSETRQDSQVMRETVTVTAAAEQAYTIDVAFGVDDPTTYSHSAGSGETIQQIRDGLISALGSIPGLTITAVSTNQIRFDGSSGTPHFHVTIGTNLTKVTDIDAVLETAYEPVEITVQVEVHSTVALPTGHARAYAARLIAALGLESFRSALVSAGVAFHRVLATLDTSYLAGSKWVTRITTDLVFQLSSVVDAQMPWIRTVDATDITVTQE
jgi:hypothetical protein